MNHKPLVPTCAYICWTLSRIVTKAADMLRHGLRSIRASFKAWPIFNYNYDDGILVSPPVSAFWYL